MSITTNADTYDLLMFLFKLRATKSRHHAWAVGYWKTYWDRVPNRSNMIHVDNVEGFTEHVLGLNDPTTKRTVRRPIR